MSIIAVIVSVLIALYVMRHALVRLLVSYAVDRPYFHLRHADGSSYMRRYWLMPRFMLERVGIPRYDEGNYIGCDFYYELRDDVRHLPAARLHYIDSPDHDREMHNHPWSFISIVLRGGYVERRPHCAEPTFISKVEPISVLPGAVFDDRTARRAIDPPVYAFREEASYDRFRGVGSIAFRSYKERHRIVRVEPGTLTLIIQGPKRQGWGFFTERGFVPWREFESVHNKTAIK